MRNRLPPPASSAPAPPRRHRIAIFGGSYNPPHLGHRAICHYLLGRGFDEVWFVPCYRHAFGKRLAPFLHRFEMCRLIAAGLPGVRVSDIERRLGGVSRTIRTIDAIRRENRDAEFSLVMGSDAMADTHKWLSFDRIRRSVPIVVIPRPGSSPDGPYLSPLSSTRIREKIRRGVPVSRDVGVRVARYIAANRLYGSTAT